MEAKDFRLPARTRALAWMITNRYAGLVIVGAIVVFNLILIGIGVLIGAWFL